MHPSLVSMATATVNHAASCSIVEDIPDSNQTHRDANTRGFSAFKIETRVKYACLA